MDALRPIDSGLLIRLKSYRNRLTAQQYRTIKGQILAGDSEGARKGLRKLLKRDQKGLRT